MCSSKHRLACFLPQVSVKITFQNQKFLLLSSVISVQVLSTSHQNLKRSGGVGSQKSGVVVLYQKLVECSLWVQEESLPQADMFRYLRVLFINDKWIGASSLLMRVLFHSFVVKKLNQKGKNLKLLVHRHSNRPVKCGLDTRTRSTYKGLQ